MAEDERTWPAMTIVDIRRHGAAALLEDDEAAAFDVVEWRRSSRPASRSSATSSEVRLIVEVLRRFGGLAPRALVGGRFTPKPGRRTVLEIGVGHEFEVGSVVDTYPSRLWSRGFALGLPPDFVEGVSRGIDGASDLPAGVLTIDRGGFDEVNSSEVIFEQAASLLVACLAARLAGQDPEAAARRIVGNW